MDIQDGRCTMDTWDNLKQELHSQFLPRNVEMIARRKLRELRHTGKEFNPFPQPMLGSFLGLYLIFVICPRQTRSSILLWG